MQLTTEALSAKYVSHLREQILFSPYLSASQLSESFSQTKGFSVIFKRSGIEQLKSNFPFLSEYLKLILVDSCNAFYLNPLVLEQGAGVKSHVDSSLSSKELKLNPKIVSVFYVSVPQDIKGGELVLQKRNGQTAQIKPQANCLLHFKGNLKHLVNSVQSFQPRISLVCEQYQLSQKDLKRISEFEIQSANTNTKY